MNSKLKTLVDLLNGDDYADIEKYLLELNPAFHERGKVANPQAKRTSKKKLAQ